MILHIKKFYLVVKKFSYLIKNLKPTIQIKNFFGLNPKLRILFEFPLIIIKQ